MPVKTPPAPTPSSAPPLAHTPPIARPDTLPVGISRPSLPLDAPPYADLDLARRLIDAEAAAVRGLLDHALAGEAAPRFAESVRLIVRCAENGGTVLVSGLGKSGLIGAKIAATLASLGIPAHFVHPSEAAHGDLGRFRPADLCIALSYSGETDEVVELAASLRQDNIPVIAITRGSPRSSPAPSSALERMAAVTLAVGDCDDAGLTPAPTCSTTACMALGDALAVCTARRRNFSDAEFARRHPGGALGGLLRPVHDILRFTVGRNIQPAFDDLTVRQALAAAELPGVRRPGALLLIDRADHRLTGIFTDADVRRLVQRDLAELDRPVGDLMTRNPCTLDAAALVRDAVRLVQTSRLDEIPVVDMDKRPVGVLDVQDLIAMRVLQPEPRSPAPPPTPPDHPTA